MKADALEIAKNYVDFCLTLAKGNWNDPQLILERCAIYLTETQRLLNQIEVGTKMEDRDRGIIQGYLEGNYPKLVEILLKINKLESKQDQARKIIELLTEGVK